MGQIQSHNHRSHPHHHQTTKPCQILLFLLQRHTHGIYRLKEPLRSRESDTTCQYLSSGVSTDRVLTKAKHRLLLFDGPAFIRLEETMSNLALEQRRRLAESEFGLTAIELGEMGHWRCFKRRWQARVISP